MHKNSFEWAYYYETGLNIVSSIDADLTYNNVPCFDIFEYLTNKSFKITRKNISYEHSEFCISIRTRTIPKMLLT